MKITSHNSQLSSARCLLRFAGASPLRPFHSLLAFLILTGLLLQSGCRAPDGKRYPISQAEVIGVDLPHKLIIIKHGEIPGLMPAMTMSYTLASPKEARSLGPGDKISAELVVSENVGHLEKILVLEKAKPAPPAPAAPGQTPDRAHRNL